MEKIKRTGGYANFEKMEFDPSSISCFLECPRKFYYRYVIGLEKREKPASLVFGEAVHLALAEYYRGRSMVEAIRVASPLLNEVEEERRGKEAFKVIMEAYAEQYPREKEVFEVEAVEVEGAIEVGEVLLCFRLDMYARFQNGVVVVDHKTTSSMGMHFFRRFRPNFQIDAYAFALKEMVGRCDGVLINGIYVGKSPKFGRELSSRTPREHAVFKETLGCVVEEMRRCWEARKWRMNTTACNTYAGCPFRDLCIYGEERNIEEAEFVEARCLPLPSKLTQNGFSEEDWRVWKKHAPTHLLVEKETGRGWSEWWCKRCNYRVGVDSSD